MFRYWTEIPLVQFFFFFLEGWRCCWHFQSLEGRAFESGSEGLGAPGNPVQLPHGQTSQIFSPLCQMHLHLHCGTRDRGTNTERCLPVRTPAPLSLS